MFAQERHHAIKKAVQQHRRMNFSDLKAVVGVSPATLRRDLTELEKAGELIRVHGGVMDPSYLRAEMSFDERVLRNNTAKRLIAAKAASLIPSGASVIIDAGSTCLEAGKALLGRKDVRIITHSVALLGAAMHGEAEVLCLGGQIRQVSGALVGGAALGALASLRADFALIGASGVDFEEGCSTTELSEAEMKKALLARSSRTILLADQSKLQQPSTICFAKWEEFSDWITDKAPEAARQKRLESLGVKIHTPCPLFPISLSMQKHPDAVHACRITGGIQDWQIFQQDAQCGAHVTLGGTYSLPSTTPAKKPVAFIRVVREEDGAAVNRALDWQRAEINRSGRWKTTLRIPTGGLYRIETGIKTETNCPSNLYRGGVVHHIGVGDLWVIAGQSNAVGYGKDPVSDLPELGVHLLGNNERWSLGTHPLGDNTGNEHMNLEGQNPGHSPFLIFAKILKRELAYPIGLIQTALGGSPLSEWNPEENLKAPLYQNLLHCVGLAGGRVRGMVWYQGESDALSLRGTSYEKRFGQFVKRVRKEFGKIPILTAQLNRCVAPIPEEIHLHWSIVKEAQRRFAKTTDKVVVIPTSDLALSDAIHTSSAGNMTLGGRFATSALGIEYGRTVDYRFPEIARATSLGGGKTVLLEFDHVIHQLSSEIAKVEDFVVEDSLGTVEIGKVSFKIPNLVRIELTRRLNKKPVVHCAYGLNPRTMVYEMDSIRPLVGFYNFPIQVA